MVGTVLWLIYNKCREVFFFYFQKTIIFAKNDSQVSDIPGIIVDRTKVLFVGTQDLCVQSNNTGSNPTIPIRMKILDGKLDWTGRKDLASLQINDSNNLNINKTD
jgi:hypothetical protein